MSDDHPVNSEGEGDVTKLTPSGTSALAITQTDMTSAKYQIELTGRSDKKKPATLAIKAPGNDKDGNDEVGQ